MDTSGTGITQLTSGSELDVMPRWHPYGQTIGFIRRVEGVQNRGLLFSVPVSGGEATLLASNEYVADSLIGTAYEGIGMPIWDWSLDGEHLALLQQIGFKTFLKIIVISTGQTSFVGQVYDRLIVTSGNGSGFAWSTDGKIAYTNQTASGTELCLLDLSTLQIVHDSTHLYPVYVCASAVTNHFAYISIGKIIVTNFQWIISEHGLAGGGPGLKWSPDGKIFLFETPYYESGPFPYRESRLGIYSLEREKQYALTMRGDRNRINYFFDWGLSSRSVYFERYKKIWVVEFRFAI